jgi:hypothetical protein
VGEAAVEATEEEWFYWYSTPELLAHVTRSATRLLREHTGESPTCRIEVEVEGDKEVFDDADEFLRLATREALRHFTTIEVDVRTAAVQVTLTLHWKHRWWKLVFGKSSEVVFRVTGPSAQLLHAELRPAVERGASRRNVRDTTTYFALFVATLVAAGSALYLAEASRTALLATGITSTVVLVLGLPWWSTWLTPALEVAPHRQSNFWRTVKLVGPIVVSLGLAGLAKLLYG